MKREDGNGRTLEHTWTEKGLAPHYMRVFERTATDVTIEPLVCDGVTITTNCFAADQKAKVILKSHKLSFFVTKTFLMKNIIVDASELIPDSTCYEENKDLTTRCCTSNEEGYPSKANVNLSDGTSSDAICSPPTVADELNPLYVPWEQHSGTQDVWKKGPFALFVLNFLRDYPNYIPTLTLEGCVFKNFWYNKYAHSLIYLDQRGARLTIKNCEFTRFYFVMGLISNIHKLTQRNNFFKNNLVSTTLSNCVKENSSLSDCHSMTIQDSTFEDSVFGNYTFHASEESWVSNEGVVLSLLEFGGPITIRGNTFK